MLTVSCPYDWRKLRYLINGLLKSGIVSEVKRINYVQSYTLREKSIQKQEEKLLLIFGSDLEKVKIFLSKQAPEARVLS
jgi:hypothetical protein